MKNKNDNNTNIFQGAGLLTECVREWDKQLRLNEWVDTDVFAEVFHFDTIHYEKEEAYKQEIKDALIGSENNLRLANDKAEELTINPF